MLHHCVIVALQGCVIVVLQGCKIVALQGCMIVSLQGCIILGLESISAFFTFRSFSALSRLVWFSFTIVSVPRTVSRLPFPIPSSSAVIYISIALCSSLLNSAIAI
jgi:hypothetical protein